MINKKTLLALLLCGMVEVSAKPPIKHTKSVKEIPSLKKVFKKDFVIGTALSIYQIDDKDPQATSLIAQQFNTATPENIMKAQIIHPKWDVYNFEPADKLITYCKNLNLEVNAHVGAVKQNVHNRERKKPIF